MHGRVLVNTGDGKGKTTAALGMAFRALGHGQRVAIVQFIKSPCARGPADPCPPHPNLTMIRCGAGFTWKADRRESKRLVDEAWGHVQQLALSDEYELLVLDELSWALSEGFLEVENVLSFLRTKPERLSVIMTGRGMAQGIVDVADTVTEMHCVKHAFEKGAPPRAGIEF